MLSEPGPMTVSALMAMPAASFSAALVMASDGYGFEDVATRIGISDGEARAVVWYWHSAVQNVLMRHRISGFGHEQAN